MPHGPLGDRIPFEGVLNCWNDDHDLPDLLLAIARSGKTGRLHFSNPEGDKTLDLQGGKIVFAESSSQDDGLGQYLLRTGKITLMDYARASKLVQPGKRLGALLVDENVLAADDLVPAVVGQVRSVILGLFRRTETWYRFKEEELEEKETITLDLAVPELILEGVGYVESWRRVSKGAGSLESVYHQAAAREEEWLSSELDDNVRELVDMLATPTTLQDICTKAKLPDFEACRYLWAFRALGWIELVDEEALAETAASIAEAAAADTEIESPVPTAADTPTMPSIRTPVPASIPEGLAETQLAVEPPATTEQEPPMPPEIPESLIQTQVSVTPPAGLDPSAMEKTPAPPAPTPIPEHLNQTQLAIEPPTTPAPPEPTPIPEHLTQTQIAVDAPKAPAPIPEELQHTQMFVETPPDVSAAPPSTGEFMESILEGDDPVPPAAPTPAAPTTPAPTQEAASPAPTAPEPKAPANHATTQFFDGPSALEPMDADLAGAAPPPALEAPVEPAPPTPPVQAEEPQPPSTGSPSGFEALASGGGPGGPSAPARPPAQTPPSPAEIVTQPSVQPPPLEGDGMASFSDLALPEDPPAQPPVPLVEAEVITADTAPPAVPEFTPEESLLPPPVGGPPIKRESLIPPRRLGDEVIADKDDFGHVLGNDD